MRLPGLLVAVSAFLTTTAPAWAGWGDEYAKRIRATEVVSPLGDGLFGDAISLFDGTVTFAATDIDLPGNNALPVRLRRFLDLQDKAFPQALCDWQLDVPYIGGIFPAGWEALIGCDQPLPPSPLPIGGVQFLRRDYWHGLQLHVDGESASMLEQMVVAAELVHENKVPKPAFAVSKWRTKDGWFFQCQAGAPSGSPTYVGHAPDGLKYTFSHRVVRDHPPLYRQIDAYHVSAPMQRRDVRMYLSKIEDRFGNTVDYVWNPAAALRNDLQRIEASDGRKIEFAYAASRIAGVPGFGDFGQLDSATAHQRTWSFGYAFAAGFGTALSSVTNPDTGTWSFDRSQLAHELQYEPDPAHGPNALKYAQANPARPCTWMPMFNTSNGGAYPAGGGVYSITHPSGARADYTFQPRRHGRANVPLGCRNYDDGGMKLNEPALFHDTLTLSAKAISGPALAPGTTSYAYADLGGDNAAYDSPEHGAYTPPPGPHTKTVTVTDPDGVQTMHTFGKDHQSNEGRLLKTEVKKGGIVHEVRAHAYLAETVFNQAVPGSPYAFPMPYRLGNVNAVGVDEFSASAQRPVVTRTTTRDAKAYTWQIPAECHGQSLPCLDAFGRATKTRRYSPFGDRTDLTAYHDNAALWVLGQIQSSTNTNTAPNLIESRTDYDAKAMPWKTYAFEQLQSVSTYELAAGTQAGTLKTIADGAGHTITLSNWKRGVPQTITYPTQLRQAGVFDTETAVVNDRGEIDSVTDELGYKTCYGYDMMGRLATVTHPSETQAGVCDTSAWSQTTSGFVRVAVAEYGIPAGHWRHTVSTGTRRKETFYDAFWRPILTRESTTDGSAGVRAVRRLFDWSHRETFASYPVATFANYTDAAFNAGTDTLYDALGRITGTAVDSELGTLATSTSYANGQTVHTNARGHSTTTTYQAFDEPSLAAPLMVTAPESTTTAYTRDGFGKPLTLTRSGPYTPPGGVTENLTATRRFVYDAQQRLCKTIEPDAGITVFDYDAAGNLAWRAPGQITLTSTSDCQRGSVAAIDKSVHQYDALNRLVWINHPTGTSDVGYTHAADGAMLTASVSATGNTAAPPFVSPLNTWTYTYKRRRLLEKESLAIAGVAAPFALTWAYNTRGDVSNLTYPSGHGIGFNPNAYGEPRQAGAYATNASYHRNGLLAGFAYGNLTNRTVTLNDRLLPSQISDLRSGTKWLDHTLAYDANGNLKMLTDGVIDPDGQPAETRTLTYDKRDRLISVTNAPTGNETYAYDPLDNVRRTVRGGIDRRFQLNAATQRLSQITTVGSAALLDYGWNERGELATRTTTIPSAPPAVVPPTVHRNGFEDPLLVTTDTFTFDRARRLMAFQDTATHQYDAHNHRIASTVPAFGTRYQVYSRAGELLYVEDQGTDERTEFFHLSGTLVAERTRPLDSETATVNYLHSDHRGTPTVKTSSAGTRVYRSRLMPYGTPYDGIYRNGPGFTKHATDEVGPLIYMQQRYFDPNLPTFISPDPDPARAGNFNRYAYANNNPYTFVDPDGRCSKITGSHICSSTVAVAAMAKTALVPQKLTASMVTHVGPTRAAAVQAKETERLVSDGNRAGQVAQISGDSRAIKAINRISALQIDSSDWSMGTFKGTPLPQGSVAYAEYGPGRLTFNSSRYFMRNDPTRVGVFLHETLHLDGLHQYKRLEELNKGPCASLGCEFERAVDVHKDQVMNSY